MTTLFDRIRLDRYDENQISVGGDPVLEPIKRLWFNKGSQHVEALIHQWINGERLSVSLEELALADAIDLDAARKDRVRRFAEAHEEAE